MSRIGPFQLLETYTGPVDCRTTDFIGAWSGARWAWITRLVSFWYLLLVQVLGVFHAKLTFA